MTEEKERLSKTDIAMDYSESLKKPSHNGGSPLTDFTEFPRDYLYMGEVCESEIKTDESIIREVLDGLISEQPTQQCTISISFARK